MRRKTLALLAATALAAAGCGTQAALTFPALLPGGGFSSQDPAQVVKASMSVASEKGSVRIVSNSGTGAQRIVSVYDVAGDRGNQTITGAQGDAEIRVVSGVAYQKASATYLEQSENFPSQAATAFAGKWISFRPGEPGFLLVSAGDTLSSALAEVTPTGPLRNAGSTTVANQAVVGVAGGIPSSVGQGTEVLYVSLASPHLPVEVVQNFRGSGGTGQAVLVFSRWGEPVNVVPPAHSVPITSLLRSGG